MMPKSIIFWNSERATSNLSPNKRRALAKTGGPEVGTVWVRLCFAGREESKVTDVLVTDGNDEKSSETAVEGHLRPYSPPKNNAGRALATGTPAEDEHCLRHCPGMSIIKLWALKKSVPNTGFLTSAKRKRCDTWRPPIDKGTVFAP